MSKQATTTLKSRLNKTAHSPWLLSLVVVALILILLRMAMPVTVKWYVNKQLDNSDTYEGSIGDVDLHLYRGAYEIENVTISKSSGKVPVPLFSAEQIHFSLLWNALLNGKIVSEITFNRAKVNIVDGEQDIEDQTGENKNWINLLNDLVPLHIDQLTINNSSLHFRNFEADNPVDLAITDLNTVATNIANSRGNPDDLTATIEGSGILAESGALEYSGSFEPNRQHPTFNLDIRLKETSLLVFRNMIKTYAPFDVENGDLSLTVELAAVNGQVEGYVKPIITDLEIFDWNEDVINQGDNPLQVIWENIIDLTSELLENQPKDQFASIIPVTGSLDNPDTGYWSAFVNILKNAFVEAFNTRFETSISPDSFIPESDSITENESVNDSDNTPQD